MKITRRRAIEGKIADLEQERIGIAAEMAQAIEALRHELDDEPHSGFLEAVLAEIRKPKLMN